MYTQINADFRSLSASISVTSAISAYSMSRLAQKPISIPEKVTVSVAGGAVSVTGPFATLARSFPPSVGIAIEDGGVRVTPRSESLQARMLVGTAASHIANMIQGSREPFVKKLIVEGIGFKAEVKGQELALVLGFSHSVKVKIPANLKVTAEKNVITVSGAEIEAVGQFAARLRLLKKPEPYKGKGIRYEGEVIRRKQGKKTV